MTNNAHYVAIVNTPGYMPMDDNPPIFDTAREAWSYLYQERCYSELEAPCDLCDDTLTHGPLGDCDDDSETAEELARHASQLWLVCDCERVGTVYGPTPGYRGTHDLGLAYTVAPCEGD